MNIDSKIVKAYISGANMCEYKNEWLFSGSVIDADRGKNIFVFPPDDNSMCGSVSETEQCFYRVIENFKPVNRRIWDALFPNWQEKQAVIDLIVGFPEPYDAVTAKSQDGQTHLIFDLICWNKYRSMANFDEIIRNVLTHELTHFLIGCYYPEADTART